MFISPHGRRAKHPTIPRPVFKGAFSDSSFQPALSTETVWLQQTHWIGQKSNKEQLDTRVPSLVFSWKIRGLCFSPRRCETVCKLHDGLCALFTEHVISWIRGHAKRFFPISLRYQTKVRIPAATKDYDQLKDGTGDIGSRLVILPLHRRYGNACLHILIPSDKWLCF